MFCNETFDENGGYWTFTFNSSTVKISSNTTEKQYLAYNPQSPRIKGYAETSSTMKFDLTLKLFDRVTKVERQNKERGQTKISLEKETKDDWGRLLKPGERLPENSSKMY